MNEHEPIHIHVSKAGNEARFDLLPVIDMTHCRGFKRNEIREIVNIIIDRYEHFIDAWKQTFG
ncbi:DUF4160 domain-containing protein [Fibrella aquatilis]|nr:DUF4160 domain-containing protein [Fibrella aquatilis]